MSPPRPPMEARSLSTINTLAANPPQYPNYPHARESLVLYLSRVPGSSDVILSTFRPQRTNVTSPDVDNSLYYIHLDDPSDPQASPSVQPAGDQLAYVANASAPRSSPDIRGPIARKPLPLSAQDRPVLDPAGPRNQSTFSTPPASLTPPASSRGGRFSLDGAPAMPASPEIPTSPTEASANRYRANPMFNKRGSAPSPDPVSTSPVEPPRPTVQTAQFLSRKPVSPTQSSPVAPSRGPGRVSPTDSLQDSVAFPSLPTPIRPDQSAGFRIQTPPFPGRGRRPSFKPFSLTIIRREPTSGHQWNVGRVTAFQTNIPTPDAADSDLHPENMGIPVAQAIHVSLPTSGYVKFRDMPGAATGGVQPSIDSPNQLRGQGDASDEWHFSRRLVMGYGKSFGTNLKQVFRRRERRTGSTVSDDLGPQDLSPPRPFHARNRSTASVGSTETASWAEGCGDGDDDGEGGQFSPVVTQPGPGLRPRGYVFTSPWGGRCEFRTSTSGRGLRCRHILRPSNQGANRPPSAGLGAGAALQTIGRELPGVSDAMLSAKPVSELRFNLPTGDVWRQMKAEGVQNLPPSLSKWLKLEPQQSDGEDGLDTPMDMLSLGREKAGGGARGKRAKLGKLIIHDEGLKMLDLVVAANIGVWWTSFERSF